MATTTYVAERRAQAVARLTDAAQWVSGDYGFKVGTPAAVKDVEIQRIGLLEYAADVLEAVKGARQAERQTEAPPAGDVEEAPAEPEDKPKAKARK